MNPRSRSEGDSQPTSGLCTGTRRLATPSGPAGLLDVAEPGFANRPVALVVGDELEQRAVRITEVDTVPGSVGSVTRDGPELDRDTVLLEVQYRLRDWTLPTEAKIAAAGWYGDAGNRMRADAGAMNVQLLVPQPVGAAFSDSNEFSIEHVVVEGVGPIPIRDVDDRMVERDATRGHLRHSLLL